MKQFLSKEPLAIQALQSGYADYKKRSEVFFEMVKDYKQALREIKNLTESEEYVGFWEDCLSEIGRKASEVLDE